MGRVSTCQKNCNTIDLRRAQVNNKSCRFLLEYIDMEPNHTLSIANIVENRYTWTEPRDVERAFHSRQISETRLKSRRHESELSRWQ